MANYTEPLQAVLDWNYGKFQYNAFNKRENTLVKALDTNCKVGVNSFGEYCRAPIQTDLNDNSVILDSGTETFSTDIETTQDAVRYRREVWGLNINGSNVDIEVDVGTDNAQRIYDYWYTKVQEKVKLAGRIRAQKFFHTYDSSITTSTAKRIIGLKKICDSSETTYGGLTASTDNGLTPVTESTATTFTWGKLMGLYADVYGETDAFFTTKDVWGFAWQVAQPQERYGESDTGKEFRAIGAPMMKLNGQVPLVWDANCPSGYLFGLSYGDEDGKHIILVSHNKWRLGVKQIAKNTPTQEIRVNRILDAECLLAPVRKYQFMWSGITA